MTLGFFMLNCVIPVSISFFTFFLYNSQPVLQLLEFLLDIHLHVVNWWPHYFYNIVSACWRHYSNI